MIRGFSSSSGGKLAEEIFFNKPHPKGFSKTLIPSSKRKLLLLNEADSLNELNRFQVKRLKGRWASYHSIRINDQFRIRFRWKDGDAYEVEICDYH